MIIEVTKPKRTNKSALVNDETLVARIEASKTAKRDKWVVVDYREVKPKKGEEFDRAIQRAGRALTSSRRYLLKRINAHYNLEIPGTFPSHSKVMKSMGLSGSVFVSEIEGKSVVVWAARRD